REANAVITDDQYLYVGTNEGLTRIDLASPHTDSTAPQLYLDHVYVNGQPIPQGNMQALDYNQNEVEFHFTALSYKSFGKIRYEYQLIGADRVPATTTNRSVRYSGLNHGTFTFQLKATDAQGVSTILKTPIQITILPPWWKTPLFYACAFCALLFITFGIYLIRVRRIRQQAAWQTEINKRFAKLELQALQSQMNPHFVFNSLSAIQYFIRDNEKEFADDYLTKFGKLMRLFLEASKKRYTTLSKEIEVLQLYIELEQVRFDHKFEYQLSVDEEIDPYSTLIPSVLLQPFVENAINHGIFHKQGNGLLKLGFAANGKGLTCSIEDNGVGRAKAQEIRKNSNKNYKSRALQITRERLDALQEFEDYKVKFTIIDLFDEQGGSQGTRVIIDIPEIE
ncbi:MAG: histidine kinase, partial [Mameliella sp.]|nr:histidine kinase [Phaeodactylibacter sp.]